MSDGTIRFDTKIDTNNLEEQLKIIRKDIKDTTKEIAKTEKQVEAYKQKMNDTLTSSSEKRKLSKQIAETENQLKGMYERLQAQRNEETMISNEKAELDNKTAQYSMLEKEISKADTKLNSLLDKQAKLEALGIDKNSRQWKGLQIDIDKAREKLAQFNNQKDVLEGGGTVTPTGLKARLANIVNSLKNFGSEVRKKHFSKMAKDQEQANQTTGKLAGGFLKIGTMFKLMLLRMAMRAVISAVKEGFNNLVQYSSEARKSMSDLSNSLTFLKNSFAAAFAPIINFIAPILSRFIDMIASAMNQIAQLFALLSGKSMFIKATKAQREYGKAIGGSAKKAKELNKELSQTAHIDELNIIQTEEALDTDAASGGAGAGVSDMFEEVPVDNKLLSWLDSIKDRLIELKDLFVKGFFEGIGDWKPKIEDMKKSFSSIMDSLKSILTDKKVVTSFNSMLDSIALNAGRISGSLVSVGLSIGQNLLGGIDIYLKKSKNFLTDTLSHLFNNTNIIADVLGTFALDVAQFFDVLGSDSAKNLTAGIIAGLVNFKIWLFDVLYGAFASVLQLIGDTIHNNIDGITASFQGIIDVFSKLVDGVYEIWNETLSPFIDWLVVTFGPLFNWVFNAVGITIDSLLKGVLAVIDGLVQAFDGLIDFIVGVFTGDWDRAWKGVQNIFIGIWNAIVGLFETAINWIVSGLNSISFDLPDFLGGGHIGFDIGKVSLGRLPMLAEGTVVPKQAGMFAAILGDNNRETEVVSPLSTMKQAFREAIGEDGNVLSSQAVMALLQEMIDILMVIANKEMKVEINDRVVAKSNDRGTTLNGYKLGFENK